MANRILRINRAPQPTLNDPCAQLKWAFFQLEAENKEPTAANFRHARNTYIRYISETNAYYEDLKINPRFYLEKYWEPDALIRFNRWLNSQNIKSKTKYSIYKNVRQVMDMAYALRTIDSIVYHAPMFKGISETKERAAYSKREQEIINSAIAKWINLGISVLNGYVPTGKGIPHLIRNQSPTIAIDGKTLPLKEAEKIYHIKQEVIAQRLRSGWTSRQAVGLDAPRRPGAKALIINGVAFESISHAARSFNLDMHLLSSRLKAGWPPEQAVGISPRSINGHGMPKELVVNGIKFESIKDAATAHRLSYNKVKHRLWCGWSANQALELEPRETDIKDIVVEGVAYPSIPKAAQAYGIDPSFVYNKIKRGFTIEQALKIVPMHVNSKDDRALLWMFENTYGCDPLAMLRAFQESNLKYICRTKRMLQLFSRWGVWPYIDSMLIMPLAVEFATLTGLNVESLKSLELDSYTHEHPLTGQPAITYHKTRSGSHSRSETRELHIATLEIEELFIDDTIAEKILAIVQIVKELTSRIRSDAPKDIANKLFIFEDIEKSKSEGSKIVVAIDPKAKAQSWRRKFAREEGLLKIFGDKFNFNIARCRPTLATNMVLAGADLFQVQTVLGHQSVQTTATYLDELQLQPAFNKTISEALHQISQRSQEAMCKPFIPITNETLNNEADLINNLHETLSGCGCKNAYNPSENVRKATNFKEGSVCKYWNMCLLCDNSIITQNSLPKLINYSNKISNALKEASNSTKSKTRLFEDAVKLINGIIEPGNIFPKEVIEHAHHIAATQDDLLLDQLIYQGI
ncbi:MAG: hypothetical protein Q8K83_07555 [Methylotenera sp.]|nr:hypothetical protein [Methylotenera sp.]